MPLYRNRFKKPLTQQPPEMEIISSSFQQSSSSQRADQSFSKFHASMNSPVYPEVLPRSASEPNESAFADDEFGNGNIEIEKAIISPGNNAEIFDELQNTNIRSTTNSPEAHKNEKNLEGESNIQEMAHVENIHRSNLSNVNKDISSSDKFPQSEIVDSLNTAEQNHVDVNNESQNKENEIPKKKKKNTKPKPDRIKNKTKSKFESQFSNPSQSCGSPLGALANKTQYSRDLDTSLNSSRSSQISMNDTKVKEAYKHFLLEKKTVKSKEKIMHSQNSDVSLNDPIVKETYSQFIEKKDKFARVNTPKELTHYDKMKWLQKQRNVGVYVHCDRCDKIRYLEEINDPTFLPDKWYCDDNTDTLYNKCEIPQEKFPLHVQEDWIDNLYNAGSIVWGRVEGYPWWPGMVEDDPNTESYYWLEDEFNDTPTYYHVTFFDEKEVTRAWLKPHDIKSFHKEKNNPHLLPSKHSLFKKRIDFALKQANEADDMSLPKRLEKYSFLARYKKPIKKPRVVKNEHSKRKAPKFNKADFVQEKRRKGGERIKGKTKKQVRKGQNLEPYDSFPTDFEIPPTHELEDISLELFEDI